MLKALKKKKESNEASQDLGRSPMAQVELQDWTNKRKKEEMEITSSFG